MTDTPSSPSLTSHLVQLGTPFDREHLADNPIVQFRRWYRDAEESQIPMPEAMTLATVTSEGFPATRMVLCKSFDDNGFVFFTNYQSNKAQEITAQPRVSLLFHWNTLQRQVRIAGKAELISREQSEAYFQTRPRASQISAWASPQSQPLQSRNELHQRWLATEQHWSEGPISCPPFWGGYCVIPDMIEFWQGQPARYHDRFRYTRSAPNISTWHIVRLAP